MVLTNILFASNLHSLTLKIVHEQLPPRRTVRAATVFSELAGLGIIQVVLIYYCFLGNGVIACIHAERDEM